MKLKQRQLKGLAPKHGNNSNRWLRTVAVLFSTVALSGVLPSCSSQKNHSGNEAAALSLSVGSLSRRAPPERCSELIREANTIEEQLGLLSSRLRPCRPDPEEVNVLRSIAEDSRLTDDLRWGALGVTQDRYNRTVNINSPDLQQYAEIAARVFMDGDVHLKSHFLSEMEFLIRMSRYDGGACFAVDVIGEIALGEINSSLRNWIVQNLERALDNPHFLVRRFSLRALRRLFLDESTSQLLRNRISASAERALDDINDRDAGVEILRLEALSSDTTHTRREEIVNLLEVEYPRFYYRQSITDSLFDIAIYINTERSLKERILDRFIDRLSEMPSRAEHFRDRLVRLASSPLTEPWIIDMIRDRVELTSTENDLRQDDIIIF